MKNVFSKTIDKAKKFFSFEEGIDITNDYAVLQRKNMVIKNIIFLSNIAYMIILFVVSLINPTGTNWVLTIILFPVTFVINGTLKRLIYVKEKDMIKQQVAMYMASFYVFLLSLLIYVKMKNGGDNTLSEAGYILLYYSLLVVSLYQDKKMLISIFKWMLVLVTVIHFTLTYDIINKPYATSLVRFLKEFFTTQEFADIVLRTLVLIVYMIVLYSNVQISQYGYEERKKEIQIRIGVQTDFSDVVSDLFDVILGMRTINLNDREHEEMVEKIAIDLATQCKLPDDKKTEIQQFASIHIRERDQLQIGIKADYNEIRRRSEIGASVARRLQLEQKCEDIIRTHIEGVATRNFKQQMNNIQMNIESQIILLADCYVTLREAKSYKRPYSHKLAIECIDGELVEYFLEDLFEKFMKNNSNYEKIYNESI